MKSWFRAHWAAATQAQQDLMTAPVNTLLVCLLISFSLSVPGIFMVVASTASQLRADSTSQGQSMTLFFNPDTSAVSHQQLLVKLLLRPEIKATKYLSSQAALEEFKHTIGLHSTEDALPADEVSLLPPTGILTLTDTAQVSALTQEFSELEQIDQVVYDQVWVERLTALLSITDKFLLLFSGLLLVGVFLVTSNTLRFSLLTKSAEFELLAIIGATRAYLVRPFLYTGFWYGCGGALFAVIIISASTIWLTEPIHRLHEIYGITLSPETVAPLIIGGAAMIGPGLGVLGAWMAVWWALR